MVKSIYGTKPRKGTLAWEIAQRARKDYLKDYAKDPHGKIKPGDIITGPGGHSKVLSKEEITQDDDCQPWAAYNKSDEHSVEYKTAKDLVKFKDFVNMTKANLDAVTGNTSTKGLPDAFEKTPGGEEPDEVGHTLDGKQDRDHLRRMKDQYRIGEDVMSADFRVNPSTGRKSRAHRIEFKASGSGGAPEGGSLNGVDDGATKVKPAKPLLKKVGE